MRYQIWDKKTDIFTPSGHKFTAAEWLARYPWADLPGVKMIITSGTINGGAAMEFQATVDRYMEMGADFSSCETDEDYLAPSRTSNFTRPALTSPPSRSAPPPHWRRRCLWLCRRKRSLPWRS